MSESVITIFISVVSLLVAIIIGVAQFVQNYRVNKQLEDRRQEDIELRVREFIIKHSKDKRYIPLCYIASKYNCHHTYNREIYNDFNLLKDEEQKELLRQLKYNFIELNIDDWFDNGINLIISFINEKDLGRHFLHDDGKYLEYVIQDYSDQKYDSSRELKEPFYKDVFSSNNIQFDTSDNPSYKTINARDYFYQYYYNINLKKDSNLKLIYSLEKPLDLLDERYDLGNCDKKEMYFWLLNSTEYILRIMLGELDYLDYDIPMQGDVIIETYEDKFLSVLMDMYNLILIKTKLNK